MIQEPLGLPKGSVRGIISLLFVITTVATAFTSPTIFERLLPITTIIVGYYFGRRTLE